MKKLFMTRSRAVAYLIKIRRRKPGDIDGLRVVDADTQMQSLEMIERLLLAVRAGRQSQFRVDFPEEIDVLVADP
ncbi:MAG TPA: hypothetical protein VG320_21275 [Paraburkholderia sp.]|jgi:hypothetical protein|uniref:hypothetical protein n=1 Tax=Paraburkholderia sp. TaxID=1926495 RepID=UPI002DEB6F6E|nr:hypothetical protein [Paraburkholderia sp.]